MNNPYFKKRSTFWHCAKSSGFLLVLPEAGIDRPAYGEGRKKNECQGNRAGEEHRDIIIGNDKSPVEILLCDRSENDSKDERSTWEPVFLHQISNDSEYYRNPDMIRLVSD